MHRPTESPSRESGQLETQNQVSPWEVESPEHDLVAPPQAELEENEKDRRGLRKVVLKPSTTRLIEEWQAERKEREAELHAWNAQRAARRKERDAIIKECYTMLGEGDTMLKKQKAKLEVQGAMIEVQHRKLRDYNARLKKESQERKDAFDYLEARIRFLELAL